MINTAEIMKSFHIPAHPVRHFIQLFITYEAFPFTIGSFDINELFNSFFYTKSDIPRFCMVIFANNEILWGLDT